MSAPVVSLFSGAGGFDLGLELAGFGTRVCVEWERYACETLRVNRDAGNHVHNGRAFLERASIIERDVRRVSGAELLREGQLRRGEAALLAGGPPCVTFSVAGKREGLAASTGLLFHEYVRLLRAVRPQGLIYENVKGLMSLPDSQGRPGGAFREITKAIAAEGYALTWSVVNAADFGVPQCRERVIILGKRGRVPPTFPRATHADLTHDHLQGAESSRPWLTVSDAISELPQAAATHDAALVANHVARQHGEVVRDSFAATPPGQRNPRYKRDRLRWDRPSKVIRAQGKPKPDGSGQKNSSHPPLHPDEPRQLTPRECARIQTFPDWYWLPSTFVNAYRVIGDAVPPRLAQRLGEHMLAELGYSTSNISRTAA